MNWQIGDFALCITPGSKLESRVVMIRSRPRNDPDKPDVVYRVHPGFPDGAHTSLQLQGQYVYNFAERGSTRVARISG